MPMQQITSSAALKERIKFLEKDIQQREVDLSLHYQELKQSLRPQNVAKNVFQYFGQVPGIRKTILVSIVGVVTGYVTKRAIASFTEKGINKLMELFSSIETKAENNNNFLNKVLRLVNLFRA